MSLSRPSLILLSPQKPQLSETLFFLTHPESNGQFLTGLLKLRKAGFAIPGRSNPSEPARRAERGRAVPEEPPGVPFPAGKAGTGHRSPPLPPWSAGRFSAFTTGIRQLFKS